MAGAIEDDVSSDATVIELDGVRVTLRPARAGADGRYYRFLGRIDPRDLRLRFGRPMDAAQRAEAASLLEAGDDLVYIATVAAGDSGYEIAGDARARIDPHPYGTHAEFAIVVRSDFQGRGLGAALLGKLVEGCRAIGIHVLYGLVVPSNTRMLALARRLGFDIEHVPGGDTAVVSLDLREPSRSAA